MIGPSSGPMGIMQAQLRRLMEIARIASAKAAEIDDCEPKFRQALHALAKSLGEP